MQPDATTDCVIYPTGTGAFSQYNDVMIYTRCSDM